MVFIGGVIAVTNRPQTEQPHDHSTHPHPDDVHVHADFLMMINGEQFDLTKDEYQSGLKTGIKHDSIHLHDNQGNIIHRHANGVTLGDLFQSIGMELTADCLTISDSEQYCTNETNSLLLYVNKEINPDPANYVLTDADQTLLYYGAADAPEIETYLNQVTDEACIYTGTCPERGTPPPEACGLTCEVAPEDLGYEE